jgi:hypothetical protein
MGGYRIKKPVDSGFEPLPGFVSNNASGGAPSSSAFVAPQLASQVFARQSSTAPRQIQLRSIEQPSSPMVTQLPQQQQQQQFSFFSPPPQQQQQQQMFHFGSASQQQQQQQVPTFENPTHQRVYDAAQRSMQQCADGRIVQCNAIKTCGRCRFCIGYNVTASATYGVCSHCQGFTCGGHLTKSAITGAISCPHCPTDMDTSS